jgi:hypothetical protein
MRLMRVGVVPTMDDDEVEHLHRAALVVARDAHDLPRWARAAVGHLQQEVGVHRLAEVGACVVWGSEQDAVASVAMRNVCATVVLVVARKPAKGSALDAAMERMVKAGSDVHVVTVGKRAKARAYDLGPDRVFREVEDLSRPPQQQHAPALPPRKREIPVPGPPPVMPRSDQAAAEPAAAPLMPRPDAAPPAPASEPPAMPRPDAPASAPSAPPAVARPDAAPQAAPAAPTVPRAAPAPADPPAAPAAPPAAPTEPPAADTPAPDAADD